MNPAALPDLTGLRILVVEDEALVAMMIEDQLTDLGCVVLGPAGNVAQGLAVLDAAAPPLDGAVLDVNLAGEKVYPIADELTRRHIPYIFATGYDLAGIAPAFAATPTLAKPFAALALATMLGRTVGRGR
ncbi:MAG TPA: response regulator [Caulobacteraceae bacterium]|jgi:CheY-like chemotaxis protein